MTKVAVQGGRPPRWRCWRSVSADAGGNAAGMGTSRCSGSGLRPSPQPCLRGPGRAAPPDECGGVPGPDKGVRGVPELRKGECRDWERWDGGVPLSGKWGALSQGKGFRGSWGAGKSRNGGPEGPSVWENGRSESWRPGPRRRKGLRMSPMLKNEGIRV